MGNPWPPPSADDEHYGAGHDRPNYALRRAIVAVVVLALVGGGLWFTFGGDGDDDDAATGSARSWDVVVLQRADGTVSVLDRDGDEVATATTELLGVTDVGLDGKVLLGIDGDPAADGLGVLSLDDGSIDEIDVAFDQVRRLGRSSLLAVSDASGTGLELVDTGDGSTTDLLALADGDDPLADPGSVRVDDAATHVAYTDLRSSETVVVDVAAGTGASLPGALVDLADDGVLTVTNRGDTVLLDLSQVTGERVGTVETAPILAGMLVGDATAVIVTAEGIVSIVDFGDESVDEVTRLATVLPLPPGTDVTTEPEIADGAVVLGDRTRLALFGERFVAFVDAAGALVRSVDVPDRVEVFLDPVTADRCLSVGEAGGPYTLLDAGAGVIVTSFDDGALVGDGADGCVVGFAASDAAGDDLVAGLGGDEGTDRVDRRLAGRVLAISADGTAALDDDGGTVSWVDLVSGELTELAQADDRASSSDTADETTTTTRRTTTTTTASTSSTGDDAAPDAIVAAAFATR